MARSTTASQDARHMGEDQDIETAAKAGRPRSTKSRKSILEATRKLLTHQTMNELSIEAIAKKAGVGKTTIYRWWPNKAAVAMDAFLEQPGLQNIIPSNLGPAEAAGSMARTAPCRR